VTAPLACRGSGSSDRAASLAVPAEGRAKVIVESPSGRAREVRVEVMRTPAEHERGLMFRQALGGDEGMLFVFPDAAEHSFWMKNTLIPLDMIFLDAAGVVVGIVENAAPMTTTQRTIGKPSRYVLEVNGGWSAARDVRPGDRVRFERSAGPD
jgi:uncharacterized membrane protein (UPF0127 family)